ncbi:acyl-coA dehydrogenase domain-containing protein [Colletotrichum tofieldiae]|uniref:Acyl-coA dehydrogenase domain-containing protein n=1 Tax=Colletotrichum tofieldiae TaxID=708197 RepID=A0A166VW60_9PEZI|nr:acyl-coA dehydrogenase domain-containing protein [Colletotrichum tofieldiae]
MRVEQISRDLRVNIVGGGSEEVISDLAVRQEIAATMNRRAKLVMTTTPGCTWGLALWLAA